MGGGAWSGAIGRGAIGRDATWNDTASDASIFEDNKQSVVHIGSADKILVRGRGQRESTRFLPHATHQHTRGGNPLVCSTWEVTLRTEANQNKANIRRAADGAGEMMTARLARCSHRNRYSSSSSTSVHLVRTVVTPSRRYDPTLRPS